MQVPLCCFPRIRASCEQAGWLCRIHFHVERSQTAREADSLPFEKCFLAGPATEESQHSFFLRKFANRLTLVLGEKSLCQFVGLDIWPNCLDVNTDFAAQRHA